MSALHEFAEYVKQKDVPAWEQKTGHSVEALQILLNALELLGDGKPWQSYQTIVPKSEAAIAALLDQVEQVVTDLNDPAKVPQAVKLWAKVQPILKAVLAEGEKNFDSPGFATARSAIAKIGAVVTERGKAAAAAAARARDDAILAKQPRNDRERLEKLEVEQRRNEEKARGHTKVDIGLIGAKVLQKQYDAMLVALEDSKSARVAEIESWKPSQTPMGGNLVLKICKGLTVVAAKAFPEVEFLVIAKEGIEIATKGKEMLDKKAEASKDEAEELKKRARDEMDKLLRHTRKYVAATQDKLQKLIEAAAEKLSPGELDGLQGMSEPQLVSNFVKDKLGIARGTDINPGVIEQMQQALLKEFNDWVKEDYKTRKLGKASVSVAHDGGNSWDAMDLREFYDMKKHPNPAYPDELDKALAAYDKKHNKPAGWAASQLKKLEEKLDKDFAEDFADDTMRSVPARND